MECHTDEFDAVKEHYHHDALEDVILAALAASGKDIDNLKPEELAPFDEFHVRGRRATLELARRIAPEAGWRVLDVGSGLGGPSRCLAMEFGCSVTGIDLSDQYCSVARMLAGRLGIGSQVSYVHGNALDLPFEDACFDLLWTQHASMNISDKERLYSEMFRVLKPGGVVALYDILRGDGGELYYPVPWARNPDISFLLFSEQLRSVVESSGLEVLDWVDATESARIWFRQLGEKLRKEGAPQLGIHLLLGPDFRIMAQNQVRNLEENRIALVEAVLRRPL